MKTKKTTSGAEFDENSSGRAIEKDCSSPREQMVATAAYYIAEKRGFSPGNDQADWFESEIEIEKYCRS